MLAAHSSAAVNNRIFFMCSLFVVDLCRRKGNAFFRNMQILLHFLTKYQFFFAVVTKKGVKKRSPEGLRRGEGSRRVLMRVLIFMQFRNYAAKLHKISDIHK